MLYIKKIKKRREYETKMWIVLLFANFICRKFKKKKNIGRSLEAYRETTCTWLKLKHIPFPITIRCLDAKVPPNEMIGVKVQFNREYMDINNERFLIFRIFLHFVERVHNQKVQARVYTLHVLEQT